MMGGLMDGAPTQGRPAGQISLHAHHCEHTRGMTTTSHLRSALLDFRLDEDISVNIAMARTWWDHLSMVDGWVRLPKPTFDFQFVQ